MSVCALAAGMYFTEFTFVFKRSIAIVQTCTTNVKYICVIVQEYPPTTVRSANMPVHTHTIPVAVYIRMYTQFICTCVHHLRLAGYLLTLC